MNEPAKLEDLLRFGCVVAGIEGPPDDEETHVASHVGVALKEKREGAQEDVDPLDLLDAPDEKDEPLALVAPELFARIRLANRMKEHGVHATRNDRDA